MAARGARAVLPVIVGVGQRVRGERDVVAQQRTGCDQPRYTATNLGGLRAAMQGEPQLLDPARIVLAMRHQEPAVDVS